MYVTKKFNGSCNTIVYKMEGQMCTKDVVEERSRINDEGRKDRKRIKARRSGMENIGVRRANKLQK